MTSGITNQSARKRRTVEQSFEAWWEKNGPRWYSATEVEQTRTWARVAFANGYRLGQRREAEKVRRGRR